MKRILLFAAVLLSAAGLTRGAFAEPIVVTSQASNYPITYWTSDNYDSPYFYMIGVYESHSDHDFNHSPMGDANIYVEDFGDAPLYLTLSTYEPINWIFSGPGLDSIAGIILNGYNEQNVTGLVDVDILDITGVGNYVSACVYTWPNASGGGCHAPDELVNFSEAYFGTSLDAFVGTYSGNGFRLTNTTTDEVSNPNPEDPQTPPIAAPVSEPGALGLLAFGACLAFLRRRKQRL